MVMCYSVGGDTPDPAVVINSTGCILTLLMVRLSTRAWCCVFFYDSPLEVAVEIAVSGPQTE